MRRVATVTSAVIAMVLLLCLAIQPATAGPYDVEDTIMGVYVGTYQQGSGQPVPAQARVIAWGKGKTNAHGFPPDAVNYPEFENTLQAVTSSLRFQFSESLAFVARHRWEDYEQDDFQFDGLGYTSASSSVGGVPVSGTTDVYLRNGLRDYDAHLVSLSAIYEF